ncbi:MAG: 50S ribosomal protein L9 [Clostridiales bacterium]|jgi:large subunit ribosomal protein L9|nr:50S ribosomal protein L9 [Clostridiales bacterium]
MEVILIQDVKSLGKKGDIVKVSDGYAKNFLIPKKLGVIANKQNLNDLKLQKAAEAKRQKEILDEAKALAESIEKLTIKVALKTGEGGRTFGSISTKEITTAIKEQFDIEIDKKKLQLSEAIKTIGFHSVPVKLHPQVTANIKVQVEAL